jgi:8-oxo-dGTP pyrophosphatase MutT (NUDIX family)
MEPDTPTMAPLIPAATVVPLRDGASGLETLMLRRNSKLEFAGGMWVWPGGRIDPGDYPDRTPSTEPDAVARAARAAAVREATEEAGIVVDPDTLVWFSHWTPPPIAPKRFGTWFFAAPAPAGEITIDGGEIHEHAWMAPAEAMDRRNALEIELSPPTWITLEHLAGFSSVAQTMSELSSRPPEYFATRFARVEGGAVALYHGDAGYDDEVADRQGGRHRLWMLDAGWRYERSA